MKKLLLLCFLVNVVQLTKADVTGHFVVKGDLDKYYPVTFADGNWSSNRETRVEIGRSNVHEDDAWRGSLIASFNYHTTIWGNGSAFISADIKNRDYGLITPTTITTFVGGWRDASNANGSARIIIWLRGGTTTYYYTANADVSPVVYDGVQNPLPFNEENGPAHNYKTVVDDYVNNNGVTLSEDVKIIGKIAVYGVISTSSQVFATGDVISSVADDRGGAISIQNPTKTASGLASNWKIYNMTGGYGNALQFWAYDNIGCAPGGLCGNKFSIMDNGNVGIGMPIPTDKLSVNGNIRSKKVIVTQTGWPDYVFDSSYQLPSLDSVSSFIQVNKHLPDMPSAAVVEKDGHDLGEVQKLLLKKMEEMTLYMIELKKENLSIKNENKEMREEIRKIKNDK